MNIFQLTIRSLIFYRKKHFSVILGVMLSATILIGALVIGDSVKYSLHKIVNNRLGKVHYALTSGDRVFRQQLGKELSDNVQISCSAILHTKGMIIKDGGQNRLSSIQFYGIDDSFDDLSPTPGDYKNLASDEIAVNSNIASTMNLVAGDEVLLRFEKLDVMPRDSPLSDDSEITVAERFIIKFIADDEKFGRFGLKSEQIAPYNVFLPIAKLSSIMSMENSANMLLVKPKPEKQIDLNDLNDNLKSAWNYEDSGLKLSQINRGTEIELRSSRIFLDTPIIEASKKSGIKFSEVFTYFVNEISSKNKSTPYSFVSAVSSAQLKNSLTNNEIIINDWVAEDLKAKIGSELKLKYFIVGDNRSLSLDSNTFIVKKIVKMEGIFSDNNLLPDYPGLAESESCLDWHPGIPIDFDMIRKKDEIYWEIYKGTPKAFISLDMAKKIWKNRFGKITAIRFLTNDISKVEKSLNKYINPSEWNIQFRDVRQAGFEASEQSVDFGGLFLGLSFFVIISALLLTGIMFLFNIESRSQEAGLFLGIGFNKSLIKKIIFTEAGILILIGGLLGCITGVLYNKLLLVGLSTIWSDVIGTSSLEIYVKPLTVIIGFLIVSILNFLVVWFSLRRTFLQNVHQVQRGITRLDILKNKTSKKSLLISIISILIASLLIIIIDPGKGSEVFGLYFFIGFLVLFSGITFADFILGSINSKRNQAGITKFDLGIKEINRKKNRSILLITLLGSSLFIVFTVGINKKNVNEDVLNIKSGTGGYSLFGETTVPVYKDLNNSEFRKTMNLDEQSVEKLRFIQMKVKSGDDASCLNLNRVKNPQVIGINPEEFANKGAFTFSSFSDHVDKFDPWTVLNKNLSNNVIPGIADASVIQWQLAKSIGDTLKYIDDAGKELFIVLVAGMENSIFQGNILISETNFLKKFPSVSGSRLFITESSLDDLNIISNALRNSMQDFGLNISSTFYRLSEFNKIENTYLSIFFILGSFGILIGSLGIGLVVFRNIWEQRREFALLQAVGFTKAEIISVVSKSYIIILIYGIFIGILAALIASLPSLVAVNTELPYFLIISIILLILVTGFISILISTRSSLKGNVSEVLRNE